MQLLNLRSLSFSCFPNSKDMTPPTFLSIYTYLKLSSSTVSHAPLIFASFQDLQSAYFQMKLILRPRPLKPQTSLFINRHAVLPAPGTSICYANSARSVVSGSILQSFLIRLAGQFPPPRPQLHLLPPRPSPASIRNSGFGHDSYRHEERYPRPSEVQTKALQLFLLFPDFIFYPFLYVGPIFIQNHLFK